MNWPTIKRNTISSNPAGGCSSAQGFMRGCFCKKENLKINMKALLINGSPHATGCTYTAEDVMQDEEGVQCMRILSRNIAFLVKAIAAEKERNGLPEKEEVTFTNFIR